MQLFLSTWVEKRATRSGKETETHFAFIAPIDEKSANSPCVFPIFQSEDGQLGVYVSGFYKPIDMPIAERLQAVKLGTIIEIVVPAF